MAELSFEMTGLSADPSEDAAFLLAVEGVEAEGFFLVVMDVVEAFFEATVLLLAEDMTFCIETRAPLEAVTRREGRTAVAVVCIGLD